MRSAVIAALACTVLCAQAPRAEEAAVKAHMAFLADDLLEGRGTGQRGGDLAVRYLETQLQALGLKPGNGSSYRQTVAVAGLRVDPRRSGLAFTGSHGTVTPEFGAELVFGPAAAQAELPVAAPLVFVGHGIFDPGLRDDYKGFDAKGKVLVMVVGERSGEPVGPLCCQPSNYYGRWTYKFEEARRRGAAGVLLIHTDGSAGYRWPVVLNSWTGERFQQAEAGGFGAFQGWLTESAARKVLAASGQDLAELRLRAEKPDFKPVTLGIQALGQVSSFVRRLEQSNVAGILPGTDPLLKEQVVIFSAHWDHFGIGPAPERAIYHGAIDNASGCAGVLAIAKAMAAQPSKRSLMFLFPCGEEQGLLGSGAYVKAPLWPLARTVLVVNLESLNFAGATRDIGLMGAVNPAVRALCEQAAKSLDLFISPAKADPAGLCFRADHFPFAKAGVQAVSPGFSLDGGWEYRGDKAAAQAKAAAFLERYHRPSDQMDPSWDLAGMMQQVQFCLELGRLAGH